MRSTAESTFAGKCPLIRRPSARNDALEGRALRLTTNRIVPGQMLGYSRALNVGSWEREMWESMILSYSTAYNIFLPFLPSTPSTYRHVQIYGPPSSLAWSYRRDNCSPSTIICVAAPPLPRRTWADRRKPGSQKEGPTNILSIRSHKNGRFFQETQGVSGHGIWPCRQ